MDWLTDEREGTDGLKEGGTDRIEGTDGLTDGREKTGGLREGGKGRNEGTDGLIGEGGIDGLTGEKTNGREGMDRLREGSEEPTGEEIDELKKETDELTGEGTDWLIGEADRLKEFVGTSSDGKRHMLECPVKQGECG